MYTTSREMVRKAKQNGYAVPAFNAEDLEMIQAIISACEEMKSPVIIQTTPSTLKYMRTFEASAIVKALAERTGIPVSLHLDHGSSYELCRQALEDGYSSIMIDGSKLSLDENIELTARVVKLADTYGVPVEGELGTIGGKEDSLEGEVQYTRPEEAVRFEKETGVAMFAAAIGTKHGFYKGEPHLNFELLEEINRRVSVPVVLHGGSGIPDDMIRRAVNIGIAKLNVATELRYAATQAVRKALLDESVIDPKKFMGPARDAVRELCMEKIKLCGSEGKA